MERTIYVFSRGRLHRRGNTLALETAAGTRYVPIEAVREIAVFGEADFNKRLLEFLSQHEVLLHYFSHYGYYMGTFYPREHYNSGYVTIRQAAAYLDPSARLALARSFVRGGYENMRRVVKYYANRGRPVDDVVTQLEDLSGRISSVQSIPELMAIEGKMRHAYYSAWDGVIQDPDFAFESRTKRPPENRLNALISFLNTLLYTTVLSEIYKTHLDPRVGYLHETNSGDLASIWTCRKSSSHFWSIV